MLFFVAAKGLLLMKRSAVEAEVDDDEPEKKTYCFYNEHQRTAAMSSRKVEKFRKKNLITVTSGPNGEEFRPVTRFKRAGMPRVLMKEMCRGFERPSAIQAQCWPILLQGHDGE